MQIMERICRAPRWGAGRLGALALGLVLAASALGPGAALAAPRASCTTVQCVITYGDGQIAERLNSLSVLSGKIAAALSAGHINSTQAGALQADVSTNQSGLTSLKATLDAETDIHKARQDVHNIYYQFRIYAVVLPRDYSEIWLDEATNVDSTMQGAETKIQNAINAVSGFSDPDNDGDLATLNAAFSDYQGQVSAAQGQINIAVGLEGQLTPQNFDNDPTGYKANFTTFHNSIHTAHTDVLAAAADLHKIDRTLIDILGEQHLAPGAKAPPEP